MTKPKPKPIRLTKQRALALLAVYEQGDAKEEAAIRNDVFHATDALEMEGARRRDHHLADARAAALIIRARYAGGEVPTESPATLF